MTLPGCFKRLRRRRPLLLRQVVGLSMAPSLQEGRVLVASGWFGRLRAHDVVIIHHQGLEKVKRIYHINDEKLYVVGDNELASTDSHDFGYLPIDTVRAKVIWPQAMG